MAFCPLETDVTKAKFISTVAACAVALVSAAPAFATAVLVTSFEDTINSGTNYEYVSATQPYNSVNVPLGTDSPSNLTFSGGSGIQANGSAWGFAAAPLGSQTGFIQSYNGVGGAISIALANLNDGQQYAVSFEAAARPGFGADPFTVSVGTKSDPYIVSSTAWGTYTFDFTAHGTSADIAFTGSALPGDTSVGLDNVTISAVPEPATWAMMLLGFGMVGFALRRRGQIANVAAAA